MTSDRLPTYAISHGGGPWPWARESLPVDWDPLERALAAIPAEIGRSPKAILMVTAHWEATAFTVQMHPSPPMLYDYGGFPAHTYRISYPAPGSPEVAERAAHLLEAAGLPAARDTERGFDHGTFVPAYVMYPAAEVPIVQLSIHAGFDPALHLRAGRALASLRDEDVLIVGSGLPSYHDLRSLGRGSAAPSREFDSWLTSTMIDHVGGERSGHLLDWADAPSARRAHPREDHFIPLLVATGAAEDEPAALQYHETTLFGDTTSSGYRLGTAAHSGVGAATTRD
ncbi:MAG: class III extradiol ring-cleavage dioxygenase [Actinomycetota bacterium]